MYREQRNSQLEWPDHTVRNFMDEFYQLFKGEIISYMNCELPDIQYGFRKGRGTRDQIANICWIIENTREFQKKHLFLLY